jgi:hypothetical protein
MADHFHTIFILARLSWLQMGRSLEHLKEHRDVVALGILTVSVRVDFQAPGDAVGNQLG